MTSKRYRIKEEIARAKEVSKGLKLDKVYIDTVEVLENLKDLEINSIWDEMLVEWGYEPSDISNSELISLLENKGLITYEFSDNTYNYSGYLSHDIDFEVYSMNFGDGYIASLRAYSFEPMLVEFQYEHELIEALDQENVIKIETETGQYTAIVRGLSEEIEVYDSDTGEEIGLAYGEYEDVLEWIEDTEMQKVE